MTQTLPEDPTRSLLATVARMATLPDVAARVISLVEDPNSQQEELQRVIEADPVLTARILKVANSPMYGFAQRISSVRRAVCLLGHAATRNITIAASMAKLFRGGAVAPSMSMDDLWQHSVGVAVLGRWLADRQGLDCGEEAYLGGLLHDIGYVLLHLANREALAGILSTPRPLADREQGEMTHFGATHAQIGSALCATWKLPAAVGAAVEFHHAPDEAGMHASVASVVHVADHLASRLPTLTCEPAPLRLGALAPLGLVEDQLTELHAEAAQVVEASAWDSK